jgi:choline monooxygenase
MDERRFEVDADIAKASTLPGWFYTDPTVYARSIGGIFERSWHWLGDTDQIRTPQAAMPVTLMEGCLDEPLVVTRDASDRLHCLSNVCTHRGMQLVEGAEARVSCLTCRYHGRRFELDGRFRSMPEFEGVEGFPSEADHLRRAPFGVWRKFMFAGVDPAMGFDDWVGEMERRVGWMPIEQARLDPTRCKDYLVHANWALYCDNYLEGFHIPFVHASLNEALDYGAYRTETFRWSNLQLGITRGGEDCFDLPPDSPDAGLDVAGYYFWLFPGTMFNFYPWGISVNVVKPLGHDLTKVSFYSYVWDRAKLAQGAGAELDRVEREDESVVEAVQAGLRSRFYDRGRFSPTRERGVHHFHRLVAEAMS